LTPYQVKKTGSRGEKSPNSPTFRGGSNLNYRFPKKNFLFY